MSTERTVELGIAIPESEWEKIKKNISTGTGKDFPVELCVKCRVFAIGVEGLIAKKLEKEMQ